jgi:hypothetical protein
MYAYERLGPTTVCFVLLKLAMVASSRFKCALTSSGGMSASHCYVVGELISHRGYKVSTAPESD